MQKVVDELAKSQQLSNYCYICLTNLSDENIANSHYNSKRHTTNITAYKQTTLEMLRKTTTTVGSEKSRTSTRTFPKDMLRCGICNVHFDKNASIEHYKGDEHKKKVEAYCNVCSISTMSKEQLWSHLHGAKHKMKLEELNLPAFDDRSPFNLKLPASLRKLMLADVCQVCKARFPTMKHALDHYQTERHKKTVEYWFRINKQNDKLSDSGDKDNKNITQKSQNVSSIVRPRSETCPTKIEYFCYVCSVKVCEESWQNHHKTSFPHTELVKIKTDMVSKGIPEEFWVRQANMIFCSLCKVSLYSVLDANEHFISADHYLNFQKFKTHCNSKILLEDDTKWFYCIICDKPLDCTSNSERHYLAPPHLKKSQLYCKICNVRNATAELLEIHNATALHKETLKTANNAVQIGTSRNLPTSSLVPLANSEKGNLCDTSETQLKNKNLKLTSSLESSESNSGKSNTAVREKVFQDFASNSSESNTSLKEQVFQECHKLIQSLYYSNTVPYNVSLEYLKNINKEINELKRKYEKKDGEEQISDVGASNANLNDKDRCSDSELYSFNQDSSLSIQNQPGFDLIDFSDEVTPVNKLQEVDCVPKEIESDLNLIDFSDDLNIIENESHVSKAMHESDKDDGVSLENITIRQELNEESDNIIQKEYFFAFDDPGNLDTILEEIILLKNKVKEKYPNEDNVEMDVLNEIESLIHLVKNSNLPADVILLYLQKFNREIDVQFFGTTENEGKHTEGAEVGDSEAVQDKQIARYRYSNEELLALRTAETFTVRPNIHIRMMLNTARIWNKHCNDLDLD